MAKTVNLVQPATGGTITGTITDEEYDFYIGQGYEEAPETPA